MNARTLARVLAAGRIGIGIALFAAPATAGKMWFGHTPGTAGQTALRGLGARDVAIGVGTLLALDADDRSADGWLDAGVVADVGDTAAILLAAKDLDNRPVAGTVVVAGSAALAGWLLKSRLRNMSSWGGQVL